AFAVPLGFSALELHRSSRRAHLINHGYLRLTLALSAMETVQANARVILERARDERDLPFVKNAFTLLQRFRLQRLRRAEAVTAEVERLAPSDDQRDALLRTGRDLREIRLELAESDLLFARLGAN